MSASREKRTRKETQFDSDGNPIKQSIEGGSGQKIATISISAFVALCLLFFIVLGSGIPQRTISAVTVGSEKISVAEYNFHFNSSVNNYIQTMQNYGMSVDSLGLDTTKPLDDQAYPGGAEGETWGSYFRTQTNSSIQEITALYLEAKAAGAVLSDELKKSIDDSMQSLKEYCKSSDTTMSKYLSQTYGKGVNESVLRHALEKANLANQYSTEKTKSLTYTDEQLSSYYTAHKADIDMIDYRSFVISGAAPTQTDASDDLTDAASSTATPAPSASADAAADEAAQAKAAEAAMAAAKTKADAMLAAITNEASFGAVALEYAGEDDKDAYAAPDATLVTKGTASQMSDELKTWLYDDARKPGDKAAIASGSDYTVVYMIKRYRDEEPTVNVRHILIQPEMAEGADTATAEQKAAAKEKADKLYAEWKNGEATEASFGALAQANSADTGSSSNGGLYENVYTGQMVDAFDAWCFDSARKSGDSGIVETDYGYHIMYFSSQSNAYWKVQVKDAMVSEANDTYSKELLEKYKLTEKSFGLSMTGE